MDLTEKTKIRNKEKDLKQMSFKNKWGWKKLWIQIEEKAKIEKEKD